MTGPAVSVVIVSRDRPTALVRCLTGLLQLQYSGRCECVVVTDPAGAAAVGASDFAGFVKVIPFDIPNISAARNAGISASSGDIIAFIDDDSVPEPSWLENLTEPFADQKVAATGGPVRGRNGISWQWQGRAVDRLGRTVPLAYGAVPAADFAVKTEGTNMAVRREVLQKLCGFDPAFAFFLDETDLNIRLSENGYQTKLVETAEVHHGFLASARRTVDRVPRELTDIAASWAVFLAKHAPDADIAARLAEIRKDEFARLDRHLVSGGLEPRDVRRLRAQFEAGLIEGAGRGFGQVQNITAAPDDFLDFALQERTSSILVCRPTTLAAQRRIAKDRVTKGEIVTLFNFSATAIYHHVSFSMDGVWEHHGGLFGKSERSDPIFRFWLRAARVEAERRRVAKQRNFDSK